VSIYGIVDAGIEHQRVSAGASGPAKSSTQLSSGSFSASRIGFRGSEDLGSGLRAFFHLENGFNTDDGTINNGALFGRRSIVGLGGTWGEASLGRDYTPAFWPQFSSDINNLALYGNAGTMSQIISVGMLRMNNGLSYASPELRGFRVRLAYGFGDERSTIPKDAGRLVGAAAEYRSSAWTAGLFHQYRKTIFPTGGSSTGKDVYQGVTGQYNFGRWSLGGGYTRYDPVGPDKAGSGVTTGLWVGLLLKLDSSDLRFNVGRIKTDLASPMQGRSTVLGVNYAYYLTKRTNLYAGIGRIANNDAAQISLEAGSRAIPASNGKGSDPSAFMIGVRHTF
jgi:predicted porin